MGFDMRSELAPVGVHLFEISDIVEKPSKKGTNQWTITLRGWDRPEITVTTWWPLSGDMAFSTRRRLGVLGFEKNVIVEARDLLGFKFYAAIKHEEYNGEMGAKVDNKAEGSTFGIWPESSPPPEVAARESSAADIFDAPSPDAPNDGGVTPF